MEQFFAKPNLFNSSYIEYISKLSENTYLDEIKNSLFASSTDLFYSLFSHRPNQ